MADNLEREYGVLLGSSGPQYMERVFWFREMAALLEEHECPNAAQYLRRQAQRSEETVITLGRQLERCLTAKKT